ncbi:MAG TPA: helix-turn-helix domain-containing protein [Solirubrobacteraceae bacterium]|jgi:excisionase family DNA binding protein
MQSATVDGSPGPERSASSAANRKTSSSTSSPTATTATSRTGAFSPKVASAPGAAHQTARGAARARGRRDANITGQLLTARVVAERLGLCTETVLAWVRVGKLPAFKLPGGAIRFREDDLNAWLEERAT